MSPSSGSPLNEESAFMLLMSNLPARAWIRDRDGRYVFVNSRLATALGVDREKCIGSTDEALFSETVAVRASRRKDQRTLSSGQPLATIDPIDRGQYLFVLRFPLEINGEPHVAGIGVETTEQITALMGLLNLNEQLFRNERLRAIGEMASGLAHDLNNSLNSAVLRLELLRSKADPELMPQVDALARAISNAADRVRNVREFVNSKRDDQPQMADLGNLIHESIELVDFVLLKAFTANGGRINLTCDLREPLPAVRALPNELKHVFANLLMNARDAMPDGGTISISAEPGPATISRHRCARRSPRRSRFAKGTESER